MPAYFIFLLSIAVLAMVLIAIAIARYLDNEAEEEMQSLIDAMELSHRTGLAKLHESAYQFKVKASSPD